jgi:hypothetical protein
MPGYGRGCLGLRNSIYQNEWNTDDTDCADTHGFGGSDKVFNELLLSFLLLNISNRLILLPFHKIHTA